MTQDDPTLAPTGDGATPASPSPSPAPRARGRLWPWLLGVVLIGALGLPLLAGGALWWRLGAGPVTLPPVLTRKIEARVDSAMAANSLAIDRIEISRPRDGLGLDLALRDLRLTDPDGTIRAAFPTIVVGLSVEALLQGNVEPLRVDLQGAGLRLARDAQGRIDLALMAGDTAAEVGLAETLARLERMFSAPVFSRLEVVRGRGLELVMADAMTGQTLRVSDAEMRLERAGGDLGLRLGGALVGSRAASIDIELTRRAEGGVTAIDFAFNGLAARDVATIGPALSWVDLMRAPISGRVSGALGDDGAIGDLEVRLDIGQGHLRAGPRGASIPFDAIEARLSYEAGRGRVRFDRFDLRAPDLSFAASGHADPAADGTRYIGQFNLTDIRLARADLWPAPLTLQAAMIDFRLSLAPHLDLEIGQAVLRQDALTLRGRGHVALPPEGVDLALDLALPAITAPEVMGHWPADILPGTRGWLAANLTEGRLSGVGFSLRATPGSGLSHALGFDFDAARVRVLPGLPPIAEAAGYLSLIGPELVLRLDRGRMTAPGGGDVALDGSSMILRDTRRPGPEAQIDLGVAGTLRDVLRLLQEPPIRLFATGAMTPDRFGLGEARLQARIDTRLMRQEGAGSTRVSVEGAVTGFASEALVPGRRLEADRLDIAVTPEAVRVSGQARFDGLPLSGTWRRELGADAPRMSRLEAEARLTRAGLAGLGVDLPDWLLAGGFATALVLDLPDGAAPELRATSDLAGAGLALPQLGWRQGADQRGRLEATIRFGARPEVTQLDVALGALDLEGRVSLGAEGGMERLSADRFRLGDWLDVTGALLPRGGGRAAAVEITGGTLDLRGAPTLATGAGTATGEGGPITATLDRLQVTEGIAISPILADLTTQGGLSGQFRGRVNGGAQITGTLLSTQTGPAIRVRADDGGDVLRSAGIFRSAHGGDMELVLQASGVQGVYDGTLRIDDPRLRNAPILAEMLNIVSVVGLINQLGGEGISMGDVEARFRITPTQLILTEGVAVGPALGLSLDGIYDLAEGQLAMQGVISPLNVVNGVIGAIFSPRREGFIGLAYELTGDAQNPQVTVNPFSILTPGVFREIFRRPPPN